MKALKADTQSHSFEARRKAGIVARRAMPAFFIVDRFMHSLHRTEGLGPNFDSPQTLVRLTDVFRAVWTSRQIAIEAFDEDTVFRIIPLPAIADGCFQVFVDSFDRTSAYMAAAKTFGLTRRESEIIPLILSGLTNVEIAGKLHIADSTVADHVKSIMRKTETTKRSQIIAKLYQLEDGNVGNATSA